jgi:hypothetical protein
MSCVCVPACLTVCVVWLRVKFVFYPSRACLQRALPACAYQYPHDKHFSTLFIRLQGVSSLCSQLCAQILSAQRRRVKREWMNAVQCSAVQWTKLMRVYTVTVTVYIYTVNEGSMWTYEFPKRLYSVHGCAQVCVDECDYVCEMCHVSMNIVLTKQVCARQ